MFLISLAIQILIAIVLPLYVIDLKYKKTGRSQRGYIALFAIINIFVYALMRVMVYNPISYVSGGLWIVSDASLGILPFVANKIAKEKYPDFNKFAVSSQIPDVQKEDMLNAVSEGVKKCCEELRGQPDDLRIFLNDQLRNGTVTELQATLLWEKFSIRNV